MARQADDRTSRVKGVIGDAMKTYPHSMSILAAFTPLHVLRERMASDLTLRPVDASALTEAALHQGIPCVGQVSFFFADDPWETIGRAVVAAIREGFPALAEDAATLETKIASGAVRLFDAYEDFPGSLGPAADRWSDGTGIRPQAVVLLLSAVTRILLQVRSGGIGGFLENAGWEKGYCPVCGSHPTIAVIREKIPQQWLHCSRCGHEWRFSRMLCPGCERESPSGIDYYYLDEGRQQTAFTCDACKRYLVTLNHISDLGDFDRDVTAMSLVHLDMILQEKGYTPLAPCEWNTF